VTVTFVATDDHGGSGIAGIVYEAQGAQTIPSTEITRSSASLRITAEGETVIRFFARDLAGNLEEVRTVTVRLDNTSPALECRGSPEVIWPPSGQIVPVTVEVVAGDVGSGVSGFRLETVTANEPIIPADVVGFTAGTPDVSGAVRASRAGTGVGRHYLFRYVAWDAAGNLGSCTATVTVPHDRNVR